MTTVLIEDGMVMIARAVPVIGMIFVRMIDEGIGATTDERTAESIEENSAGMTGTMIATTAVKVASMIGMTTAMTGEVTGTVTMMISGATGTMIAMIAMVITTMIVGPTPAVNFGGWIEPIMWPASMDGKDGKLLVPRRWIGLTGRNVWKGRITLTDRIGQNGRRDPNARIVLIDQTATDGGANTAH